MSRRLRRAKTATTLGSATDRDNNLKKVIAAGTNTVRMNPSCDSLEDHKIRAGKVREIAAKLGRHAAILGDLQGPKICVLIFKEGKVFLNIGDKFLLDANLDKGEGGKEEVGIGYEGLPADVVPGDILLLDDGRIRLKVPEVQGMKVLTEVIVGGFLSNNKGINKFGGGSSIEALAEEDKADIKIVALIGIDYLTVFFPCCGEDLNYTRRLARNVGCDARIIAKVERAETVCSQEATDDITLASDVVIAVRGDLDMETDDPELIGIQKALIRRVRQFNRAVTTATQMMESMVTNPVPTRTEIMNAANTIPDSTDAVMLSVETAAGQYLSETVAAMARVYLGAEEILSTNVSKHRLDVQFDSVEEAIAMSAMYVANYLRGVAVVITMTESGRAALITFRIDSGPPIFAMLRHERTLNLITLYRDVTPIYSGSANDGVATTNEAVNLLRDKSYLMSDDLVTVTQDDVMNTAGSTNITRILAVE